MILINTFSDLWKQFTMYPTCLKYYIEDEYIIDDTRDIDEMQKFWEKYANYKVVEFCIRPFLHTDLMELCVILRKGEGTPKVSDAYVKATENRDIVKIANLIKYLDTTDNSKGAKISEIKYARDCGLITDNEAIDLVTEFC